MNRLRWLLWMAILGISFGQSQAAGKTQARLLLSVSQAKAGESIWAGIHLKMPPGWHTYWKNSGESGMPTKVQWQLPPGISVGEPLWPPPEKHVSSGLTTFVYHGEVMLLVPLQIKADLPAGEQSLRVKVSWMECEALCLPGEAELQQSLRIGPESKAAPEASMIAEWKEKLPQEAPSLKLQAYWSGAGQDDFRPLILEWQKPERVSRFDFFPFAHPAYEVLPNAEDPTQASIGQQLALQVKKRESWPAQLQGLLVAYGNNRPLESYNIQVPINEPTAVSGQAAAASQPGAPAPVAPPARPALSMSMMVILGVAGLLGLLVIFRFFV